MASRYVFLILSVLFLSYCETLTVKDSDLLNQTGELLYPERREFGRYLGLVSCAVNYNVSCFMGAAEEFLEARRTDLLAEADAEVLQSAGRSDSTETPSELANTTGQLITELTKMIQNWISSLSNADDDTDDDVDEVDGNTLTKINTTDTNGETRDLTGKKKKKKKPLKSLIRLIKVAIIALIIVLKLAILLKLLQTAMQFKFLLISLGTFAIQAAKFWMSIKNKKEHEEIVYKNPYPTGDEYSSPPGASYGGEYNAARSAQAIAYSLQRTM